jgi:glycosyltransferase involved in cell wall biosynthesis
VARGKDLRAELGLAADTQILLMLASYEPRKGHAFMIEAMRLLRASNPGVHLVACGHGLAEEIDQVRHRVAVAGIGERVHLLGFRDDIGNLLAQASVLVIPSQAYESFGYTAVEAMACGVPLVATTVGGLPEVLDNGSVGLICAEWDVATFAANVNRLLNDSALHKTLTRRGLERYSGKFTAARMASEYCELLA